MLSGDLVQHMVYWTRNNLVWGSHLGYLPIAYSLICLLVKKFYLASPFFKDSLYIYWMTLSCQSILLSPIQWKLLHLIHLISNICECNIHRCIMCMVQSILFIYSFATLFFNTFIWIYHISKYITLNAPFSRYTRIYNIVFDVIPRHTSKILETWSLHVFNDRVASFKKP